MVRAALGVVYLLASATANGWNLLQLGLLTGTNSSDDLRNRTEAGPRDRGGPSRPDPGLGSNKTWDWWSVAWDGAYHYVGNSWWIKMWVRMLLQVAENGISYCGTLCASIGLAARWSYWLLTGMVLVFLLQLLVWTYTWVIHPTWIHSRALWRYCQGTGTWSDVTRLQGQRPFIPVWKGPGAGTPWSALYIQREVRGRGPNQKPFDLLVADGVAVARLRHGTIRGRTNRHGFLCQCEEVRASSHRYLRHHIETANCAVHLCAQDPCTAPEVAQVHIRASATVPQDREVNLQELAGRGPWGRCAVITSFCGILWCRCFGRSMARCGRAWCWCLWCRCCRTRRVSRPERGAGYQGQKHEDSETESEAELGPTGLHCQADQVALDNYGKVVPLAAGPCRDVARGCPVVLLQADRSNSCLDGLPTTEGGDPCFHACEYHRSMYQGSLLGRACAVKGCLQPVTGTRKGVNFCKLHGATEEKPRAKTAPRACEASPPQVDTGQRSETARQPERPEVNAMQGAVADRADLAELLVELLQGKEAEEAYQALSARNPGDGKWKHPGFQDSLTSLAKAYVQQHKDLETRESPAWRALNRLAHPPAVCQEPAYDPVTRMLEATLERPTEEEKSDTPAPRLGRPASAPASHFPGPRTSGELAASLFRPKSEIDSALPRPRLVSSPGAVGTFPGMSGPAGFGGIQGLHAFRPFHAGAYTDPGPPAFDETSKALQTIAKVMAAKEDPAAQDRGKLSSIGRTEERMLYLARGCDTLTVHLGEATVGKELYHALKSVATQNRPLLREISFPVNITNRIAFGAASLSFGGKGNPPDYCLTVADFAQTSEEEFDLFSPPGDNKLEKRARNPTTLSNWYRNALRQAWAMACILGAEYYGSWEKAAAQLLKFGEEYAHAWPLHSVMSVWEELWARFTEELRALDRRARREMQDESPSFDRLRFFATSPGENGEPWLRLPQTFDLQAPGEYFQTDIVPRQQRMLDRACWSMALKRPSPLTGGRAGAEDIGGPDKAQPSAPNPRNPRAGGRGSAPGANTAAKEPAPLLGNALTSKEAGRSMDHRPKDKDGKYLCWDYFSHRKCNKGKDCPHSHHGNAPRWDTLDWSVQMQLLRRGGHPARPKLKGDQVDATIESIRKEQAQKLESNIQEGKRAKEMAKRTGGPPPQDASTQYREDTRAGWTPAPAALANFAATDMEDPLARLMTGEAAASWTLDHEPPAVRTVTYREPPDSAMIQAKRHCMDEIDSCGLLPDLPQHLGIYLRNRLTAVNDRAPNAHDVQEFLEDAIREGSAELASEATDYLHNHPDTHVGSREGRGALGQFSAHGFDGYSWATFRWRDGDHAVYDYGDQLAPVHPELQPLECPKPETEPRQCFYLHVAAGLLAHTTNRVPALSEVRVKAAALQEETFRLAMACADNLGPEPDVCTQAEDDLRIFVHDALFFGHDKDYRCLAAFPPAEAAEVSFCLVRMDAWNRISCEVIQGAHSRSDPKSLIWLLVHQGHMRLLLPEIATSIPDNVRIVTAAGWEVHLEAAAEHGARHRARAPKPCPRCQDDPMRRTGVTTGVFGLYTLFPLRRLP